MLELSLGKKYVLVRRGSCLISLMLHSVFASMALSGNCLKIYSIYIEYINNLHIYLYILFMNPM
jgi:hypothetical protein